MALFFPSFVPAATAKFFTDLGSIGANGSTANNQASLTLTMTQAINAGDFVVLVCADDNWSSAGDGTPCPARAVGSRLLDVRRRHLRHGGTLPHHTTAKERFNFAGTSGRRTHEAGAFRHTPPRPGPS